MILSKIISTTIKKGRLIIKILGLGNSDIKTAYNLLPFGIDSRATKGYRCIYSDTGINGEKILLGVICQNILTEIGETRIFSEDVNGNEVFSIHLKNDGTCEIGGNTDNLARYSILNDEINGLKTDFNNFVSAFNQHVHATAAVGTPSPPTTVPSVIPVSNTDVDISGSKIDSLLTP